MSALTPLPEHFEHSGVFRRLEEQPTEPRGQDGNPHGSWTHAIERAQIESGLRRQPLAVQACPDSRKITRDGVPVDDAVTPGVATPQPESAASLAARVGTRNHRYDDDAADSQGLASGIPAAIARQLAQFAALISGEAAYASSRKTPELKPQRSAPEPLRICWKWQEDGAQVGLQLWLGVDRECLAHLPEIIDFLRRGLEARGVNLCGLVCNGEERLGTSGMRSPKPAEPEVGDVQGGAAHLFGTSIG
jgi:hypothetical protein